MTAFNQAWNVLKKASNPNYLYHRDINIPPYHPTSHREIVPNPYSSQEEKENKQRMMNEYMERMKHPPYPQGNPNDNNLPYNPYQPQPKPFEPKRNPFEHEKPPYQPESINYEK
jgi:hypothetical protein